jgi:exodeoxyribonuclease-3
MKLYSWNVNGLRAAIQKGFWDWFDACDADVVGLQEIKAEPQQLDEEHRGRLGYEVAWNPCPSARATRAPACAVTRGAPLAVAHGPAHTSASIEPERPLHSSWNNPSYPLLTPFYSPTAMQGDERLEFKLGNSTDCFLAHSEALRRETKPIVVCGDFNTAHKGKSTSKKYPKANENTSGFLPVERAWIGARFVGPTAMWIPFLACSSSPARTIFCGPTATGPAARQRGSGGAIDYFFSQRGTAGQGDPGLDRAGVMGSDHCPVGLEQDLEA